jgi:hypothetical protein
MSQNSGRPPLHLGSVYVQRFGAGNRLDFVIGMGADGEVSAYKGGGVGLPTSASFGRSSGVASLYAQGKPVGTDLIGARSRYIVQFKATRTIISALRALGDDPHVLKNLQVASGAAPASSDQFDLLTIFVQAAVIDESMSKPLIDSEALNGEARDEIEFSALDKVEVRQVSHLDESGTVTTAALNDVVPLEFSTTGRGEREVIAVGDATSGTLPRIYYGLHAGGTVQDHIQNGFAWVQQTIAACTNGAAEAVAVVGGWVVIACSGATGGMYSARLADVKAGTATFTLAAGITSGWAFYDVAAIDEATVLAVGASGRIALSTDGGFSFSLLTSPVSSTLRKVACGVDKSLAWCGGDTGVVIRIKNLAVATAVTVTDLNTNNVTAMAVPERRPNELYIGSETTGLMIRTVNAYAPSPMWESLSFWMPSGNNTVKDIQFTGTLQAVMYVLLHNPTVAASVLLRDTSGGKMGRSAVAIGTAVPPVPSNTGMNSIAALDPNFAVVVGEVDTTYAFIGKVAG